MVQNQSLWVQLHSQIMFSFTGRSCATAFVSLFSVSLPKQTTELLLTQNRGVIWNTSFREKPCKIVKKLHFQHNPSRLHSFLATTYATDTLGEEENSFMLFQEVWTETAYIDNGTLRAVGAIHSVA